MFFLRLSEKITLRSKTSLSTADVSFEPSRPLRTKQANANKFALLSASA